MPICVSKALLGLLLQFCFLDAMFIYNALANIMTDRNNV